MAVLKYILVLNLLFYGRHSRPFSLRDLSVGSGGTLPMQALVARPAMKTWHVAQSPL